jgi:protein-disulfide isomerase
MIPSQVNRLRALALALAAIACAPAKGTKQGAETTAAVTRADTSRVSVAATPDSSITRADLARIQGSSTAPVWVILVSDFQCPYCKEWHDRVYTAFVNEFVTTGKVRLAYINFPLNSHVYAWPSAEAAMCAGDQGKFWQMHDGLFATQQRWEVMPSPAALFDSLARSSGVDIARWRECVQSGKMKPLIQADHDRAAQAGASATPSFMIGDRILTGAQPIENIRQAIDSAAARAAKPSSP